MDCAGIFTDIYRQKRWGDGAGGGSLPEFCGPYMRLIEQLSRGCDVLDIGCGDGLLASRINWSSSRYIGVEIVPDVAEKCVLPCICADAMFYDLPRADLVIVKEVMQHLSEPDIRRLLGNIHRCCPDAQLLHCSYVDHPVNRPTPTGGSRCVDLAKAPFELSAETVLEYRICDTAYFCQLLNVSELGGHL